MSRLWLTPWLKPWLILGLGLFCLLAGARAHEVRPAYLELQQTGTDTYSVLWKVPALENKRLAIYVVFPEGTHNLSEPQGVFAQTAYVERWSVQRSAGLGSLPVHIDGLSETTIDVLVHVRQLDGRVQMERLSPARPDFVVQEASGGLQSALSFVGLGAEHILSGPDHLLFVLGLLWLVRAWRRLLLTISAFTLAHCITLAAVTLGAFELAQAPLELSIALSILFLGVEIAHAQNGRPTWAGRYPWAIAFLFGLLHGCGFASGLVTTGLPAGDIPFALVFFNLGVEAGQLGFIALVFALLWALRALALPWPRWSVHTPAYLVGSAGAYWTLLQWQAYVGAIAPLG